MPCFDTHFSNQRDSGSSLTGEQALHWPAWFCIQLKFSNHQFNSLVRIEDHPG